VYRSFSQGFPPFIEGKLYAGFQKKNQERRPRQHVLNEVSIAKLKGSKKERQHLPLTRAVNETSLKGGKPEVGGPRLQGMGAALGGN